MALLPLKNSVLTAML